MELRIASLRKEIFIPIVYGRVNISHHGSLPGTTSDVLTYFSVSRSHLLNIIASGGIRLNFLCGSKAKDATTPRIQKMMHRGIYFGQKNVIHSVTFAYYARRSDDCIQPWMRASHPVSESAPSDISYHLINFIICFTRATWFYTS